MILSEHLPRILEAGMLICFGLGWPISIIKSLRTKYVRGKSPGFMLVVSFGYSLGIISKLTDVHMLGKEFNPVTWLYILNLTFIIIDLSLFIQYRQNSEIIEPNTNVE